MQTKIVNPLGPPLKPASIQHGCTAEYKLLRLREVPLRDYTCDTPERCATFAREHITGAELFDHEREHFFVLMLNTRRNICGFNFVSSGTLDTLLVHPREVFRVPVVCCAAAVVLMHNHPSGDPTPSEADIKVTRDMIRAGQLLKVEVLDHVIIGRPCVSLATSTPKPMSDFEICLCGAQASYPHAPDCGLQSDQCAAGIQQTRGSHSVIKRTTPATAGGGSLLALEHAD